VYRKNAGGYTQKWACVSYFRSGGLGTLCYNSWEEAQTQEKIGHDLWFHGDDLLQNLTRAHSSHFNMGIQF